jgi:two-component system, NarL family, sensor histidine kinase LiaS
MSHIMNRQSSFWVVLGGTAAAFMGWLFFSYLFRQEVNWLLAVAFAGFFSLLFGGLAFMRARPARLQWQLTFSYTWVTVAALLVVELLLLSGLLALVRSNFLLNQMGEALYDLVALEAQTYLQQEPPDVAGLQAWVNRTFDSRSLPTRQTAVSDSDNGFVITRSLDSSPASPNSAWSFRFDDTQTVYVLDAEGRLLAENSTAPGLEDGQRPFTLEDFPQLAGRVQAIQQGERDLAQLRYNLPNGQVVNLFPLVGDDGRLLGVLLITLPLPALNAETLGPLLTMILYSLLPLTLGAGLIGAIFGFLTAGNLTRRIRTVGQAAESWSQGDFSAVAQDPSPDELGQLSRRLNQMAEQLQNLLETRQELAALEERNRLARDLHDAVKQQIFAVSMQVGAAQAVLPGDPAAAAAQLEEAATLAREAQQELSGLIRQLRPAALYDQGLTAALRQLAADWSRQNQILAEVQAHGERPLPLGTEQVLFRVAQEALANVARHSGAGRVALKLSFTETAVALTIHDDGQGFDPATARRGLGLDSMRERVEGIGGRFTIASRPNTGTTLTATAPIVLSESESESLFR